MPTDDDSKTAPEATPKYMGHPVESAGKPETEIKVARTQPSAALLTQLNQRKAFKMARGGGPAHTGSATFRVQRLTALALAPLVIWFVISLLLAMLGSQETAQAWLSRPVNAALLAALTLVALRHATIGIQVVLEDYVHNLTTRTIALLGLYGLGGLVGLTVVAALIVLVIQHIGSA